jgi:hypothetical protein
MDLKQLKAIIKIMREGGALSLETPDIKLALSPEALLPKKQTEQAQGMVEDSIEDPWAGFPTGMLSPEQLAFYSSGGKPEEDPENQ